MSSSNMLSNGRWTLAVAYIYCKTLYTFCVSIDFLVRTLQDDCQRSRYPLK